MARDGHKVLAYVDDFCGVESDVTLASKGYHRFIELCADLGWSSPMINSLSIILRENSNSITCIKLLVKITGRYT